MFAEAMTKHAKKAEKAMLFGSRKSSPKLEPHSFLEEEDLYDTFPRDLPYLEERLGTKITVVTNEPFRLDLGKLPEFSTSVKDLMKYYSTTGILLRTKKE